MLAVEIQIVLLKTTLEFALVNQVQLAIHC